MTNVVLYPNIGNDIVTPILCGPKVFKIYAFGPIPKGQSLTKNIQKITQIANIGHTGVFKDDISDSENDEIEDLLDLPLWCSKSVHFKTKNLYYMQFKYGYEDESRSTITLYYYYKADIHDKEWPLPKDEKIDYIIYKGYELSQEDKAIFKKRGVVKPTTKVFSTEYKLLSEWDATEEDISSQEFVDVYDVTKHKLMKMYSTPYRIEEKKESVAADSPEGTDGNNESQQQQRDVELSSKPFFRSKAKKEKKNNNKKKKK